MSVHRYFPIHRRLRLRSAPAVLMLVVGLLAACGSSGDETAGAAIVATTHVDTVTPSAEDDAGTTAPIAGDVAATTSANAGEGETGSVDPGPHDIATTPGWESSLEPILEGLAATGDPAITFDLDITWMDSNAGEDVEQRIIGAVASGELDAGFVGVRALSALGVSGFDALVAPGLVDSYELQEAIVTGDIPGRLLPELDAVGVRGIAVVPGPMRYPIGIERGFAGPDDYAGVTFHTFPAEINRVTAEALGASHSQVWGGERDDAIDAGKIDVTENSLTWMRANGRGAFATLDPLWPATAVLVVNPGLLDGLDVTQVDALLEAVVASSPSAADLVASDRAVAADLCEAGKQFVAASSSRREALNEAFRSIYATLAADATTGPLVEEIARIKPTLTPTEPTFPEPCDGAGEAVVAVSADDPSVIDGAYRVEWTVEELMAELEADEHTARNNAGQVVLTFDDGEFEAWFEATPDDPCNGSYGVVGDRVQLVASDDVTEWTCSGEDLGNLIVDAAWRIDGDQFVLSDFVLSPQPDITWWFAGFLSKPMTRLD